MKPNHFNSGFFLFFLNVGFQMIFIISASPEALI